MDFRSQLSAFQSGGSRGRSESEQLSQRSPQPAASSNNNYYGRGRGDDRRRSRDYSPQSRGPPQQRRRHNEPDRDGLGDLRHHGYKIPRGHPPPPTEEEKKERPKHLALLLICIDDIPYEHVWKEWCDTLNSGSDCHISLVCHAKYPAKVKSEWLRKLLLVFPPKSGRGNSYMDPEYLSRTPEWGSVEITRAMLDLLSAGLKIGNSPEQDSRFSPDRFVIHRPSGDDVKVPPVDQFLYISESCLPVATAQEFFEFMDNTVSWVNARHRKDEGTPKNAYENEQFSSIHTKIPGQYRWKADQWVLLCRKHASQIMGIDRPHIAHKYHLWHCYQDINASDEMYIPTTLALLGFLRFTSGGEDTQRLRGIAVHDRGEKPSEPATPENTFEFIKKRPVSYTDWSQGARNPATFAKGIADFKKVSRVARGKGCLIARKFAPCIIVPGVDERMLEITGQISAGDWRKEIDILKEEFRDQAPQLNPETSDTAAEDDQASTALIPQPVDEAAAVDGEVVEEESFWGGVAPNKAKADDEADDEEENQL